MDKSIEDIDRAIEAINDRYRYELCGQMIFTPELMTADDKRALRVLLLHRQHLVDSGN